MNETYKWESHSCIFDTSQFGIDVNLKISIWLRRLSLSYRPSLSLCICRRLRCHSSERTTIPWTAKLRLNWELAIFGKHVKRVNTSRQLDAMHFGSGSLLKKSSKYILMEIAHFGSIWRERISDPAHPAYQVLSQLDGCKTSQALFYPKFGVLLFFSWPSLAHTKLWSMIGSCSILLGISKLRTVSAMRSADCLCPLRRTISHKWRTAATERTIHAGAVDTCLVWPNATLQRWSFPFRPPTNPLKSEMRFNQKSRFMPNEEQTMTGCIICTALSCFHILGNFHISIGKSSVL